MTSGAVFVLASLGAMVALSGCATRHRELHPPGVAYHNVQPAYCPYGNCAAGTWIQKQEKAAKANEVAASAH